QGLAPDLVAAAGDLAPHPGVDLAGAVAELAGQGDHLGDDQLGDAPRVAEGGVEDGDAVEVARGELDLVDPDAEAADRDEARRRGEDALRDPGLAADAEDLRA